MFRRETLFELLRGAVRAFLGKGLAVAASFALTLVIARSLGPADTGIFFLALTIITVLGMLARLGLDQVVVRETAAERASNSQADILPGFLLVATIVTAASVGVTGLMWATASFVSENWFGKAELARPLKILCLAILPLSILFLNGSYFAGLHRVGASALMQTGLVPIAACVILLVFGSGSGGLPGVAAIYLVAAAGSAVVSLPLVVGALKGSRAAVRPNSARRLLRSGMPLLVFGGFNIMLAWTDIVVLGIFASSADVGAYTVANRTAMLVGLMIYAVNAIAAPKIAALRGEERSHEIKDVVHSGIALSTIAGLPVIAVICIFPEGLLNIFGAGFAAGSVALVILAAGYLLNATFSLYSLTLIMCGYEKPVRNFSAFAALVNLVLNVLLIPRFGLVGAATATAFSVVLKNALAFLYISRNTDLFETAISSRPPEKQG